MTTRPAAGLRALGDLARAGDGVDQGAERGGENGHPLGLGAQLEQALLGLVGKLDPGGDRVGIEILERVVVRALAPDAFDELGECLAGAAGVRCSGHVRRRVDRLDLRGGKLGRLEPIEDSKRPLAGDDDVQPTVVEPLGDLGDPRLAEWLAGVEAAVDHPLVTLLEDVEWQQLAGKQHDRELEDRKLDRLGIHTGDSRNG